MPTTLQLTIREADGSLQERQVIPGAYLVGREADCQIRLASPDVSRKHAQMIFDDESFTIEDLNSKSGTIVNGSPLKQKQRFAYPQSLEIGSVNVRVSAIAMPAPPANDAGRGDGEYRITMAMAVGQGATLPVQGVADRTAQRLEMLYNLPLQFAAEPDLRKLYKLILRRVMELIPGAKRGALLIIDPASNKLALRASEPEEQPPISRTLIKRAAAERQGFIWGDEQNDINMSLSMVDLHIRTGMYVPLVWKSQVVGVLCVDNPKHRAVFRQEDLQFLISVAHYAAAAVANQLLQDNIEQNNRTLQHLLANFSPKLRGRLLEKSREGRLQPGGEKSDVTILMSDLRGFTLATAKLDSEAVVSMLNDYFSVLGDIIFQHDGTIDKFIGDAILAVFGSPEPDPLHAHRAVHCATAMHRAVAEVNKRRAAAGMPVCELGIGIHTGEVLHGFIGAKERLEYTVIGDPVNKTSRYCDAAGPGEIVLGETTHRIIADQFPAASRTVTTKHEEALEAFVICPAT